jgi:hypothetical protein
MFARALFALLLCIGASSAREQHLRIVGTAGYLSEWELNAEVAPQTGGSGQAFSGSVRMKHVGLCTVNGPVEKSGKLTLQMNQSAGSSRLQAVLSLDDGDRCSYVGPWSGRSTGTMDCSGGKGIPLTLSVD